ncbi:MAG: helix-turn-helix domain-containing protein [Candidatus Andersenbacteria bacterium]
MKKNLKRLGFTDIEAAIYMAVVKDGPFTVTRLAKFVNVSRTSLYSPLNHLHEKGLVSLRRVGKQKIVAATPSSTFESLASEYQEQAKEKEVLLMSLKYELEKIVSKKESYPFAEILEGKVGIQHVIDLIIEERKDIYWIGSFNSLFDVIDEKKLYRLLTWRRMAQGTKAYAITDRSILKNRKFSEKIGSFRNYRFLDKPLDGKSLFVIFGSTVALASFSGGGNISIVLVSDDAIATLARMVFQGFWDSLKE